MKGPKNDSLLRLFHQSRVTTETAATSYNSNLSLCDTPSESAPPVQLLNAIPGKNWIKCNGRANINGSPFRQLGRVMEENGWLFFRHPSFRFRLKTGRVLIKAKTDPKGNISESIFVYVDPVFWSPPERTRKALSVI